MIPFAAEFVTSAFARDGWPRWSRSEVALAGRSNVGKSSLLNALAGVKGLARTSKTPGRTRCLNFFSVNDSLALCDLPGFGYAKMSHDDAAKIASMMVEYLREGANLDAIAILIDCRRGPQDDELDLAALAAQRGIGVIPVATKCDKLRRSERVAALKRFDPMGAPPIFVSATSGEGLDDLRRRILAVGRVGSATFDEWVKWVFDHPVAIDGKEDEWYRHLSDEDKGGIRLDRRPERALAFVTKLFENPLAYLSRYSDAQIGEGLWFIVFRACSRHFDGLVDARIDLGLRTRCVRSIENLSRELFAPRCSDNIRRNDASPLDQTCCMLWDLVVTDANAAELNLDGTHRIVRNPEIDKEFLDTLARILAIPSVACQQSALHGLGHLVRDAKLGSNVIQQFLDGHPSLRTDLREYAERALVGRVQ
jgi:GTP-binding protein